MVYEIEDIAICCSFSLQLKRGGGKQAWQGSIISHGQDWLYFLGRSCWSENSSVNNTQDPNKACREFLHGLQEDGLFIDMYRFLNPYDLSYTWKVHNTKKRSRIDLAFANQNLISSIREMNHTWCPHEVSDHAMVTVRVDFEMIDRGHGIFKCPLNFISTSVTNT